MRTLLLIACSFLPAFGCQAPESQPATGRLPKRRLRLRLFPHPGARPRPPDGSLLAFAEARRHGTADRGDIDLVVRRSADEGRTWGEMTVVWDDAGNTCGNPAPVLVRETGRIVLLACWNSGPTTNATSKRARPPIPAASSRSTPTTTE